MTNCSAATITLRQGYEFTSTAYRRQGANNDIVVAIPSGFEARMKFALHGATSPLLTLTSNPAAGLTIDYPNGAIAIYMGATETATLTPGVQLLWSLEIYDPLNPDAVIFLGSGTAAVKPQVG